MEPNEEEQVVEIDLNRENYFDNPDFCPWGSLVKFLVDPKGQILDLKTHFYSDTAFKKGDVAFVVKSYQNKNDRSLVLCFVLDQEKYMMYCTKPEQYIEVVRRGTTKKKEL